MKTIRVLCLHGLGDSAEIFRAQTAGIRSLLPKRYSFVFAEGPHLCEPLYAEIAEVFPGPYRCWYTSPSVTRMTVAHAAVRAAVLAEGPFDIVVGFSQGAVVASSLLLHDELERQKARERGDEAGAQQPPLFRAAVFICSPLPFSKSLAHGIDTRLSFGLPAVPTLEDLGWGTGRLAGLPATLLPPDVRFLVPDVGELQQHRAESGLDDASGPGPYYQMFHPSSDPTVRVSIPTAHILGRRDKLWGAHSKMLVQLCSPEGRSVYDFDGGHEIPKDEDVVADISDIIETLAARAGLNDN